MNILKTCFGISSVCKDGKHVIFFDFDDEKLYVVVDELKNMQLVYDLSDFYILNTSNGYNAFCLDKLEFKELLDIYSSSNRVCKEFIKYCTKRKHFTLRMSNDKSIISTVICLSYKHDRSNAHKIFFTEIMGYNIRDSVMYDDSTIISIDKFLSNKYGVYLSETCKT